LTKKHRNGHIPKVDWLDRLAFREIEVINEREKRNSDYLYLMIDFPLVELEGTLVSWWALEIMKINPIIAAAAAAATLSV